MPVMDIVLDGDGAWPDVDLSTARRGEIVAVAPLSGGMESGRASVTFRIHLEDGAVVLAETSLALFLAAASAFRARFGD